MSMGRLFWKIFFFIWLAQLTTIWGVGVSVWFIHYTEHQGLKDINTSRPALLLTESAAATLQYGGVAALRNMMVSDAGQSIYAVDETGHELLGRTVAHEVLDEARHAAGNVLEQHWVRQIDSSGHRYLLFLIAGRNSVEEELPRNWDQQLFPMVPVIAATIASFIFAALLAWYFAKPIRSLRRAFESVAEGNFNVHLDADMGQRRDDLADLGRDFDRMSSRLKALLEGQRRLLKDISHELRSPLARLQIAIGLVRQQPEKLIPSLDRIDRESERMDMLVGELLELSKLEAGVPGSTEAEVNLDELLDGILEDARFEAEQSSKLVACTGQGNVMLKGSAELLYRAIENVVRNAVKYTPDGTRVEIDIGTADGWLVLSVCDQGSGVPDEELGLIFEPFFRGSGTQNGNIEGHGLGLAIARRIFEAHGGTVRAFNRETAGLCVVVRLPLISH